MKQEIEIGVDYIKDENPHGFIRITRVDENFVWGRQFIIEKRTLRQVCIDIENDKFWIKNFHKWQKRVIQ